MSWSELLPTLLAAMSSLVDYLTTTFASDRRRRARQPGPVPRGPGRRHVQGTLPAAAATVPAGRPGWETLLEWYAGPRRTGTRPPHSLG